MVSFKRISIRFRKQRVPRPHRALTAPSAPRHTPHGPRHAFDNRRFARPPLRSRAGSIKRPGTEQAGPDPIRPSARVFSATVTRFRLKEYGCSRLSILLLGRLGSSRPHSCLQSSGVLGLIPAYKARAFSALPPLIRRLGRSRPYPCLQSSGVLGSASAHHKPRAFSALSLLTELGRSRLCLRSS